MLTFFDYLRQRAFESVLSGAQEALELLENQKNRDEPKPVAARPANRSLDFQPTDPAQQDANKSTSDGTLQDDEPLQPARRRGRPQQKSKGNG